MESLVIIAGPTAVGKSALSVELAKRIGGEIVSADSMQVYRGMDIGTAKITSEEMQGIQHYLIDICEPDEDFNVFLFQKYASQAVSEINKKGKVPILVGGTGFYIQALLYGIDFNSSNGENPEYRERLEERIFNGELDAVYEELRSVDPKTCEIIHKNNTKRVIRALEFYHETGKPISLHNEEEHQKKPIYNSCFFVLNDERETVYDKINRRVDLMVENGLVEEVKGLKDKGYSTDNISMLGLGYKEVLQYLDGEITLERAIELIKQGSRHYAKKQITWFKREREVIWLNRPEFNQDNSLILNKMISEMKNKGII